MEMTPFYLCERATCLDSRAERLISDNLSLVSLLGQQVNSSLVRGIAFLPRFVSHPVIHWTDVPSVNESVNWKLSPCNPINFWYWFQQICQHTLAPFLKATNQYWSIYLSSYCSKGFLKKYSLKLGFVTVALISDHICIRVHVT
jgi:hypothetical protein